MGTGVQITGPINTYPDGAYPTNIAELGKGGLQSVANQAARNAIPTYLRTLGMLVVCQSDPLGTVWQLNTLTNTSTDSDWDQLGGVIAASTLLGNPTGSPAEAVTITLGTNLSFSGDVLNASLVGAPGSRTFVFGLAAGTNAVVATDVAGTWTIINVPGSFARWDIVAKTPPVGASLVIDILLSTNGGSTWTSLWSTNPSNRPTLATTVGQASGTSFDNASFAAGNLLRIDVISIGSSTPGSGISVILLGNLT